MMTMMIGNDFHEHHHIQVKMSMYVKGSVTAYDIETWDELMIVRIDADQKMR
jgi:hypothetical protein